MPIVEVIFESESVCITRSTTYEWTECELKSTPVFASITSLLAKVRASDNGTRDGADILPLHTPREDALRLRIDEAGEKLQRLEPVLDLLSLKLREKVALEDLYIRVLEARIEGFGPKGIGKQLNLPEGIVRHWIYHKKEPLGR